ncbi:hypothetical protein CCR95_02415 [Thiocystis minor]|uniref:hypothetical protein n=1 Tax=Thiocystis minor TaxID=61597 RepID=UPI001914C1FF|nr:hypothetical protein [Thiocystis minor]MBK5962974.1 hypothetical protein [Thiocystis minor]
MVLEQSLTEADDLKLMAYAGTRGNEQFLAVPISSQNDSSVSTMCWTAGTSPPSALTMRAVSDLRAIGNGQTS